MALKSTIFKTDMQIADRDRNRHQDDALTIARDPSETSIIQSAVLAKRNMQLQCSIQDGSIWLGDAEQGIQVESECRE